MPDFSKKIVYLSQAQYQELITNDTITVDGVTVNYNDNDIYVTPQAEPITDVKIDGTSIGNNGVANIPRMSTSGFGVARVSNAFGIGIDNSSGNLQTILPSDVQIQDGTMARTPITPQNQHKSTFYGLAKAAGYDEKDSTESLGTYTNGAKAAIQNMLGITNLIASEEAATATAAHAANSLFMMDGKLMRATTAIAVADAVEVGTNCEVTSISESFATNTNLNLKADKTDTVLNTTLSMGRKANTTVGLYSTALGHNVTASESYTHAEGVETIASSYAAHAEGGSTRATGAYSHAEGGTNAANSYTVASGAFSHAEGCRTEASGNTTHSEGYNTHAIGNYSHASGYGTYANGDYSHAEGVNNIANGACSYVIGKYNIQDSFDNWPEWVASTSYIFGDKVKVTNGTTVTGYICKTANSDASFTSSHWSSGSRMNYVEIVGNGTSTTASNARTLTWEGDEHLNGYLYVGCNADSTGGVRIPHDVQVNGTSVVSNGVASIPIASSSTAGVIKINSDLGIILTSNNQLQFVGPTDAQIKAGTLFTRVITPFTQHKSVFYGLAKAAGDSTQSVSTNAVGTYTDDAKAAIQTMLGVPGDVQVNGTSVVSNGVANIPVASSAAYGVVKVNVGATGVGYNAAGELAVAKATSIQIKAGTNSIMPIAVNLQHEATFYGLAKAAGDTTQSASSNAVGTYTTEAKAAIQSMLGIQSSVCLTESVTGTTPSITAVPNVRYICGEVTTISITPPANGTCDVIFESGSTATTLTVPNTVKWPSWFDATSLETDTIYELMITDAMYGSVMSWATT